MEIERQARSKKRYLRVTFPDGRVLCYNNSTFTFLDTLRTIGIEKLKQVQLEISHKPMISQEQYPEFGDRMKPLVPGWYVNTTSDSGDKYRQLVSINNQLGLNLKLEIGEDFETTKALKFQKSKRPKDSLLVKLPDGNFIGEKNPRDTFLKCIEKLGVRTIKKLDLKVRAQDLITDRKIYDGQMECDGLWVTLPNTTNEKYKILKTISALMRINLELSIF